jgi:hypothetical protein
MPLPKSDGEEFNLEKEHAMKSFKGVSMAVAAAGFAASGASHGQVSYKDMADALHAVMESDRTVYTRMVVNRLQNEEKVIKATEHFKDDKSLPLPAQMFRFGAEMVSEKKMGFSYSLQSLWPINKQNLPKTALEKKGLEAVAKDNTKPFYGEETLGKVKYFTAIYADKAVAPACVTCHNDHKDTPKKDFKIGETMGGVVLRIPMK